MLEHRIRVAKKLIKEICILLVDIKNAFDSVPHRAIVDALRSLGAGDIICDLVTDIYTNAKICLLTAKGLSEAVGVLCGVKQGCALTSILFILAIDPIFKAIQRNHEGIHNLFYADDEVVVEDSKDDLEDSTNILVETANMIGLTVNPKKCYSLHIRNDHKTYLPSQFYINGEAVTALFNYLLLSTITSYFRYHLLLR